MFTLAVAFAFHRSSRLARLPADAHADDQCAPVRRRLFPAFAPPWGDRRRRGDDGAGAALGLILSRDSRPTTRGADAREHDGHGARAGDVRNAGREWMGAWLFSLNASTAFALGF